MKNPLGESETKVLIGLARHPELANKQLAKKLGITPNNLATIKHRLEEKGIISYLNELNLRKFPQAQVVAFEECEYVSKQAEVTGKDNSLVEIKTQDSTLSVRCFKTFEESEAYKAESVGLKGLRRFLWKPLLVPEVSRMDTTARMLEHLLLGKEKPAEVEIPEKKPDVQASITSKEKKVLSGLIESHGAKDAEIANGLRIHRSNFSTIKKSLTLRKLFIKTSIVDMKKICPHCLSGYAWIEARTPWQGSAREKFLKEVLKNFQGIEKMWHSEDFILAIGYFKNFEESETARLKLLSNVGRKAERVYFRTVPLSKVQVDYGRKVHKYLFEAVKQKRKKYPLMVEEDFRI